MDNEAIKDEICKMWEEGKTGSEISSKLNITRCAFLGHVHRLKKQNRIKNDRVRGRKVNLKNIEKKITKAPPPAYVKKQISENIGIMDLKSRSCRYIVSGEMEFSIFCGKDIARYSYCEHHAKLCYVPIRK